MSNKTENVTTKFKVDISDLKKNIADANKNMRLANAEFKSASAGVTDWGNDTEIVSAKIKQQEKILDAEKSKLSALEEEFSRINSKEKDGQKIIDDLTSEYMQAEKQFGATSDEAKKYAKQLSDAQKAQERNTKASDDLQIKILNQQASIKNTSAECDKWKTSLTELKTGLNKTETATNDLSKAEDDNSEQALKVTGGFSIIKDACGDLVADGIGKVTDAFKELMSSADEANNTFATMTGTSTENMSKYSDAIQSLYSQNYGESLNDVSESMAKIKQQTKETDPTALKDLTKNALLLRDTFGYEVDESIRSAQMLMTQFGISGEDAFNLIAQGTQNGLDKNGDLLDSLNEYSVHYSQMGYSATDFFNSLENGTEAGTFSVDKLGDAMKEFGIRSKDTANTTTEGFELIGLNADDMRDKFAQGGDTAQEATQTVLNKLLSMDDQVKQNQAGVDLFGTMWEDLGKEGVTALTDVSGTATTTIDTMKQIDDVKYDDVNNQLEELKRTFETSIIQPTVKKAIPYVKKLIDKIKNMDFSKVKKSAEKGFDFLINDVLPKVEDGFNWIDSHSEGVSRAVKAVGTAFVTWKVASEIALVTGKIQKFSTAIKTGEGVMKAMNTTMNLNPAVLLATGLATLTVCVLDYCNANLDAEESVNTLTKKQQELIDKNDDVATSYQDRKSKIDETCNTTSSEFSYYDDLWEELQGIVHQNGEVYKGYEDRAKFIVGTLSEATDTEITITNGVIDKYKELSSEMDNLLEKKKAQAILDGTENEYSEALKNNAEITKNYVETVQEEKSAREELIKAKSAEEKAKKRLNKIMYSGEFSGSMDEYNQAVADAKENAKKTKESVQNLSNSYVEMKGSLDTATQSYEGNQRIIKNYEGLSSSIISGDNDKISDSLSKLQNDFANAETSSKETLKKQISNYKSHAEELKQAIKDGTPGITQEMVTQADSMVSSAETELKKAEFYEIAEQKGLDFSEGVYSQSAVARKKSSEFAEEAKNGLNDIDTKSSGNNFMQGFIDGINEYHDAVTQTATGVADDTFLAFNTGLGVHSPSVKAKRSAEYFDEGAILGFKSKADEMNKTVKDVFGETVKTADNTLSNFNGTLSSNINSNVTQKRTEGITATSPTFIQNNYSPKALSNAEIYRQSKNLLKTVKGV